MLVSGIQQSDSVIHIHIFILFEISFPYRLLKNIEALVIYSRSLLSIIFFLSFFFFKLYNIVLVLFLLVKFYLYMFLFSSYKQ